MKSKLIKIFKVKDFNQLIIIFIVFGITGSLSVVLGKYVLIKHIWRKFPKQRLLLAFAFDFNFSNLSSFTNYCRRIIWAV